MTDHRIRSSERKVYTVVWVLVVALYVLNLVRVRYNKGFPIPDWKLLTVTVRMLAPFFILFIVNNFLIARLLLRNKMAAYFISATALFAVFFLCQDLTFHFNHGAPSEQLVIGRRYPMPPPPDGSGKVSLLPMPLLLDVAYGLVVVGCNLAVSLMFQHFADRIENERFMKINAENQLAHLRDQINPHFYMNMLNNIHGMIEIDPAKAQTMVLDMSHLMRYMLYESSLSSIPLAEEIEFLENYMRLMRIRYPEGKVSMSLEAPSREEMNGISVPPILYLVFVENAFKHGISYQDHSFIDVVIRVDGNMVEFSCVNSLHDGKADDRKQALSGIGLSNVRQRLGLIYGRDASLNTEAIGGIYKVNLIIPKHNAKNSDNR